MTRINTGNPRTFVRQHVLAELREAPRIFQKVRAAIARGERPEDTPQTYRMGKGHMRFFYCRLKYLKKRQQKIINECLRRGYKITHTDASTLGKGIPAEWWGDWRPTARDHAISDARMQQRLKEMGYERSESH